MKVKKDPEYSTVVDGLRDIYSRSLKPLEQTYLFPEFNSPLLENGDFTSKPMILLLGQYSTGKTTFIKHLIGADVPGMHIGPEPTTDTFNVVMDGEEGIIPGNVLVADSNYPFRALIKMGNGFLNRFQSCRTRNSVLKSVTLIDTPGILSGEKQRIDRGYDFIAVTQWFAERVDRIILLFDAYKLDISDEFRRTIESLRGYDEKIRIVLNKADMIDTQQLMRVYGALMWGLGKVLGTPEVCRVYIGSFWGEPLRYTDNRHLFELEARDLLRDIQTLPSNAATRKMNDVIKRARMALVHAYIISKLGSEMPKLMGKSKAKNDLISKLETIFDTLARTNQISRHDFPSVEHMRLLLKEHDFSRFPALKQRLIDNANTALSEEIPRLMNMMGQEHLNAVANNTAEVSGGVFESTQEDNMFSVEAYRGINRGRNDHQWIVESKRHEYDRIFDLLNPRDGFLSGEGVKSHLLESKLSFPVLRKIWQLADVDNDGKLDCDEFALAKYLVDLKLSGHEITETLPPHLVPPSKRKQKAPAPASPRGVPATFNGNKSSPDLSLGRTVSIDRRQQFD